MEVISCEEVAKQWENWCGDTPWSRGLREFGDEGGKIIWYCGFPRSKSAIPLCFSLVMPSGIEVPGSSRLKDIKEAIHRAQWFNR